MTAELSLWSLFSEATLVVKCIMLGLIALSVTSWAFIIQRWQFYKKLSKQESQFENRFNDYEINLMDAYKKISHSDNRYASSLDGFSRIFKYGTQEFGELLPNSDKRLIIDNSKRAMDAAILDQVARLEQNLSFLATVGSVSPYIGLFGTAWGIMHSFIALGSVQQATLSMVAPGIAEALIATAMGLFAAIPASIAYNRFANYSNQALGRYERFQMQLTNLMAKQLG